MVDEREVPAVFGLIGTPKARIRKKTKLFQSEFEAEEIVRSIASARASATEIRQRVSTELRDSDGNAIETAKL